MEVWLMSSSQAEVCKTELGCRDLRSCFGKTNDKNKLFSRKPDKVSFDTQFSRLRKAGLRFTVKAVHSEPILEAKFSTSSKSLDKLRLFVGLPLDTVSDDNTVNHARAIGAGLKALKLLGVEGVELPVWWGVVENEMGKYDWLGYLAVAEMVQKAGLKLHVSLCFHASVQQRIPLPKWVMKIGESQSSIFFTDRSGQHYRECLSLAVDDLSVLDGKTPLQVYRDFCESFKSTFSPFIGSTITAISMGLGPDGELRYPSHHKPAKSGTITGVGEFQCYDTNMLNHLKQHAEANGNPLWGLDGPHDSPTYDQAPNNFFNDHGGSWESPYGDFFLSWYSSELVSHGNRLLSIASSIFGGSEVVVYGKVPLIHSWNKTRAHPSELTAGFYNTASRNGYEAVAEMFARNSCKIILPGMDLSDEHQPHDSLSSPESLLAQIRTTCNEHGVEVAGQNLASGGLEQIKKNMLGENPVNLFTYHRMGAHFFSPEHFPSFTEFVRSLNQPELHADDFPSEEGEATGSVQTSSDPNIHLQTA
ncbi:Inactive beta-amylase 9 [Hibiscus syriacus]|uniref:Beta-amylase n=1 Tax=Hibiscus syriacus TaxID=106335 RepID=A0A6A3CFH7_HIBSY|nr:inactive beta-amylase 9-like [Hibiscus syriacus]XP_039058332.1 inactive beta-amylase 9-like [Hibiscus syriacus]XP_039058333.1 inactive beta-amylase 9-like [Hibiscus syriacus]XP_039058334.1 inactive beta-amylase 9-like [Hibiscus syriacus]KAE8725899.1 Inactive beta-amylase 9 [Hibiscus syriacus]